MKKRDEKILEVMEWFRKTVSYEGEPYVIDYEQAMAVADDSQNTIVVARAGSGKTRTLVAKIVYLVARCGVKPDEIMAFVFNANAAKEINERLAKMMVGGKAVISEEIASTFHAFSGKVVYALDGGEKRIGKILAEEKEVYILKIVWRMIGEAKWKKLLMRFIRWAEEAEDYSEGSLDNVLNSDGDFTDELSDDEVTRFASMMTQFVNRAQQKYLGGEVTLGEVAKAYFEKDKIMGREILFVKLGVEVFRRYHWYLLGAKRGLAGFSEYGTDFNLIVSWASKLIRSGRRETMSLLRKKKYILIDEYQDFSQLFMAEIEAIREVVKQAKLFVVGDDWQAINRFAGSDVEYFKEFENFFPEEVRRIEITTNYRCDKVVVETARKFMKRAMSEKGNFRAFSREYGQLMVVTPRETELGYALVPYDFRVGVEDRILREATERMECVVVNKAMVRYLKIVVDIIRRNIKMKSILILHRNNETRIGGASLVGFGKALKWGLDRLGIVDEEEFDSKVSLMTMHKSKGLEADVVIILEADEGVIPKIHPDTLLYGMFGETEEVALDDQKRLFYVAMTRAKHRLYIISEGGGFVKFLGMGF